MRNCIVLGSGRSGTSMVAGTLAKCGYFMGENLYRPREANPKGFFEAPEINGINEDLLARVLPRRPPILGRWFFRDRPARRQRWLARVPVGTPIRSTRSLDARMAAAVGHEPFCYKDPRFCYTLAGWRPHFRNIAYVCVFRDPATTATSIVKECQDASYLRSLAIDIERAVEVWRLMYEHVLIGHRHTGDWLFLHYDQVLDGSGLARLERHLDVHVDAGFPDAALRRSQPAADVPAAIRALYDQLCRLADFTPD